MLDLRFYNILKANGWESKEIDDFNNYYDEFLKDNEPDFTLFINYLHEKGFNLYPCVFLEIFPYPALVIPLLQLQLHNYFTIKRSELQYEIC